MIKNGSFSVTEVNDTHGYVDFETTLEIPAEDGGGFVHLQGRVNITRLPPEQSKPE